MPYCGDEGYVQIGLVRLDVTSWTATETAEKAETTNTGSAGWREEIACIRFLEGSAEADFDPTEGPKVAPNIAAGDEVVMELHTGDSGQYNLTALIDRLRWTMPARDKITYSFDFSSQGEVTYTP